MTKLRSPGSKDNLFGVTLDPDVSSVTVLEWSVPWQKMGVPSSEVPSASCWLEHPRIPRDTNFTQLNWRALNPQPPLPYLETATRTAMGTLNFLQPGHITDQMKPRWSWYVLKFIPETNTWVSLSAIFLRLAGSSEEKRFGLSSFAKWWDIARMDK